MLSNFQKSLNFALQSEGLYVDNPADPGGATMKGITLDNYRIFKKNSHLTANDLKNISDADVHDIYLSNFWNPARCSDLPSGIDYCVFDFAINAGVGRSIKTIQKCVGADIDGVLGSITIGLIGQADPVMLINQFSNEKEAYYQNIVANKPGLSVFLKGWFNRIDQVKQRALTSFGIASSSD